jgi:hypothetical protein
LLNCHRAKKFRAMALLFMASSLPRKLRIAYNVLFAPGFWDAVLGRITWQSISPTHTPPLLGAGELKLLDIRGGIHLHTCTYSDGASDVPTVMEAAHAAGLDFILLTDHNTLKPLHDGWEEKYPLTESPFLLVGTEVTVKGGAFLLALDFPNNGWEPIKEIPAQEAINDVLAQGAWPLISLPFDMKHPWEDWKTTGCEGLEVINLSTIARRHINLLSLLWLLPLYKWRGPMATIRAICTRPDEAIKRWEIEIEHAIGRNEKFVGIGALDAHALMKIGAKKYPIPSYEDSFRALTTHVLVETCEKSAIYKAFRQGNCYFAYDCLGDPKGAMFTSESGKIMGDSAPLGERLTVTSPQEKSLIRLYHKGKVVAASISGSLTYTPSIPGAYRVEIYRYQWQVGNLFVGLRPWVFTNPIYVGSTSTSTSARSS